MTVTTYIERARERATAERRVVDAKLEAFDAFVDRVETLPPEPRSSAASSITAPVGGSARGSVATDDRCRTVRTAFDETIRARGVADESEPLLEAIRSQFTESIAAALAPTTESTFSPNLKRMILSEATARRAEAAVLGRALDREGAHLKHAREAVDDVTAWIADADETPLTDLGFGTLRRRHETLATHRGRCDELARRRQAFLRNTTNEGVEIGVRHRSLLPSLYEDFPVDHPLLATLVRLDSACAECQRAVREHLVRRV